jgi:hypothetical protein
MATRRKRTQAITVLGPREAMREWLKQIDDEGGDTDEGAIIVTLEGYISGGEPDFFSTDFDEAFMFEDREDAEDFLAEFADILKNPQVLDCG